MIEQYAAKTGHVQIADNPGRGAPGTGSLPLEELLDQLSEGGLRRLGRPRVQAGRQAQRRGLRLAAAAKRAPPAEHTPTYFLRGTPS